jgi:hypothetical protein
MPKWADYLIYAVQFNSQHTHINRLRIYVDNGDSVGQSSEHSRQDIVTAINKHLLRHDVQEFPRHLGQG